MILPVIAFIAAVAGAVSTSANGKAFVIAKWNNNGSCDEGTITEPVSGSCPGGSKTCKIDGQSAYSNCDFSSNHLLKYN